MAQATGKEGIQGNHPELSLLSPRIERRFHHLVSITCTIVPNLASRLSNVSQLLHQSGPKGTFPTVRLLLKLLLPKTQRDNHFLRRGIIYGRRSSNRR